MIANRATRWAFFLLVLFVGASADAGAREDPPPHLFIVAVGVGVFLDKDVAPVPNASADARRFAAAFAQTSPGTKDNVTTDVLTDRNATGAAVRRALKNLTREATDRDTTVILLSGHGFTDADLNFCFVPYDFRGGRFKETSLDFGEALRTIDRIRGRVVLFTELRRARSATDRGARGDAATTPERLYHFGPETPTAHAVLISALPSEAKSAPSEAVATRGAFVQAITEALAPTNTDGRTISDLRRFVEQRVPVLTGGSGRVFAWFPDDFRDFVIAAGTTRSRAGRRAPR